MHSTTINLPRDQDQNLSGFCGQPLMRTRPTYQRDTVRGLWFVSLMAILSWSHDKCPCRTVTTPLVDAPLDRRRWLVSRTNSRKSRSYPRPIRRLEIKRNRKERFSGGFPAGGGEKFPFSGDFLALFNNGKRHEVEKNVFRLTLEMFTRWLPIYLLRSNDERRIFGNLGEKDSIFLVTRKMILCWLTAGWLRTDMTNEAEMSQMNFMISNV